MPSKGLKINNANSSIPAPPPDPAAQLDQVANAAVSRLNEYKARSLELGMKFKALMEDQVLSENKSPLVKDLEQEILIKLTALASDINSDDTQPEGAGGVALCQLLMKMLLWQRDKINQLSYRLSLVEKKNATTP